MKPCTLANNNIDAAVTLDIGCIHSRCMTLSVRLQCNNELICVHSARIMSVIDITSIMSIEVGLYLSAL